MANEALANGVLAPPPDGAPSEDEYRAFCAALEASARGRAFLAEYARRNRHADTETVLAALDRLATLVRSQAATAEAERIRQELRALLAAMRSAQPAIDASAAAIKAAKLAALIGFVQHRIESIVAPAREHSPLPVEVAALVMVGDIAVDAARSHLAVVPRADEPELPIPAPAAASASAIALVQDSPIAQPAQHVTPAAQDMTQRGAAIIPEVNLFDGAPVKPAVAAPVERLEHVPFAPPDTPLIPAHAGIRDSDRRSEDRSTGSPLGPVFGLAEAQTGIDLETITQPETIETLPADDPLALIMALSEAERIALFS